MSCYDCSVRDTYKSKDKRDNRALVDYMRCNNAIRRYNKLGIYEPKADRLAKYKNYSR